MVRQHPCWKRVDQHSSTNNPGLKFIQHVESALKKLLHYEKTLARWGIYNLRLHKDWCETVEKFKHNTIHRIFWEFIQGLLAGPIRHMIQGFTGANQSHSQDRGLVFKIANVKPCSSYCVSVACLGKHDFEPQLTHSSVHICPHLSLAVKNCLSCFTPQFAPRLFVPVRALWNLAVWNPALAPQEEPTAVIITILCKYAFHYTICCMKMWLDPQSSLTALPCWQP